MTTDENSILEGMVERALASLGNEEVLAEKEEEGLAKREDEKEEEGSAKKEDEKEEGFAEQEEAGDEEEEERPAKKARTKRPEESHQGLDVEGQLEPWYPPGYGRYGYGARGGYGYRPNRYGRGGYYGQGGYYGRGYNAHW